MSARTHSPFSWLGNAVSGVTDTFVAAREMKNICDTPEAVYRARGTSRDAVLRAYIERI